MRKVRCSRLSHVLCAAAMCLFACSGSTRGSGPAGNKVQSCATNSDCSDDGSSICKGGFCQNNSCSSNSDCEDGWVCSQVSAQCEPGDGGSSGNDGGSGGNDGGSQGGPCQTKDDCQPGQACNNGVCGAPPSMCGADSQCARGQNCGVNETCIPGCDTTSDCASGQTCNTTTFLCTGCSASSPCPSGQTCESGTCNSPITCTTSSDCNSSSPGSICVSGTCGSCSQNSDCSGTPYGTGYVCTAGACTMGSSSACSATCSAPTSVCDSVTGDPDYGTCVECVTSTDCTTSGDTCTDYQCTNGSNVCGTTCPSSAPVCDSTTGDPDYGECVQCVTSADCASGDSCSDYTCSGGTSGSCPAGTTDLGNFSSLCSLVCTGFGGTCDSAGDCCISGL